jgi:hypothetical protein
MEPIPPAPTRGVRLVDGTRTRALACRLHDLAAITRDAALALARAEGLTQVGDDRYEGLRFRVGDMPALLVFDLGGEAAYVKVAEAARRGKHLDALYAAVCADVAAELGPAVTMGREPRRGRWACWRARSALLFFLQIDDLSTHDRQAVKLWRSPWTAEPAAPSGPLKGELAGQAIEFKQAIRPPPASARRRTCSSRAASRASWCASAPGSPPSAPPPTGSPRA